MVLNHTIKYIISGILLVLGLGMLVHSYRMKAPEEPVQLETQTQSEQTLSLPVRFDAFEERIQNLRAAQDSEEKILPLMVVTPKVCPPCVNNIDDYAELLGENPLFFELTLVFVDEERTAAERFVATSKLGLPFERLSREEAVPLFRESEQNLIFIDLAEQRAFYNARIPNGVTLLAFKEEQLREIAGIWESRFAGDNTSGTEEVSIVPF